MKRSQGSYLFSRAILYTKEWLLRQRWEFISDPVRTAGQKLPVDSRAGVLAYFAKHNEQEGISLIEQALSELKPGEYPRLLTDLTALYYTESIGAVLKKLLEIDDASQASHAAYLIGLHGLPGDEKVLEARLKRWREQWRDRVPEADAQHQGQVRARTD